VKLDTAGIAELLDKLCLVFNNHLKRSKLSAPVAMKRCILNSVIETACITS